MSKKNGRAIHSKSLRPSSHDEISLCLAVDDRYRKLCQTHASVKGSALTPPTSLDVDMLYWRETFVRYRKGDFRTSEFELESLHTIAQWTVDVNCELRNQPAKKLEWS